MEHAELLDIGQTALWVLVKISAPVMIVSLVVGLTISLFQALTQIQEVTLTFVPKIFAIFVTLMLTMPFIMSTLKDYNEELMAKIAKPSAPE